MHLELFTQQPEGDPQSTHPTPLLFVHGAWHGSWCWNEHFLPYFVADVKHIPRQLDRPPVLIGHSMGGLIVQKYLETHSVPAAVLLASVPPAGVLRTTLRIARRHPLAFLKANGTLQLYPIVGTLALTRE